MLQVCREVRVLNEKIEIQDYKKKIDKEEKLDYNKVVKYSSCFTTL